jgi:exonuclease VII small subunit
MLVDRDKAIEACAKALEDFWGNGSTYEHCAAAIRKLTLEDCAPITPTENVVVLQLRTSADGMAFESYGRWSSVCRDAANLIESLSAQVDEEHERAEAYANIASKLQDKLYAAEAQVSELTSENKRICELHKVLMKNADERLEAAEAQVAELREDALPREPTVVMLQAALEWNRREKPHNVVFGREYHTAEHMWKAMIDAAKESGNE